jgi:hypothetical protein
MSNPAPFKPALSEVAPSRAAASKAVATKAVIPVAAALLAIGLAACGSSTTGTTGAGGGSGSSTTASHSSTTASASPVSKLAGLSASLRNAQTAPYKATYSATYNGKSETLTFEQDPPKSFFSASGGEVIDTGTSTYFCSTSGTITCLSASTQNPLASLLDVLSPKTTADSLSAAQSALAAKVSGYSATFSSQTFAGQPTTCVTITGSSGAGKYCVTGTGQLAYVSSSPSQVFEMTSYSSTVDQSDFSLPQGASVVTVP